MKKYKFLVIAIFFSSTCFSQNFVKGFKLIDKGKYNEATSFFNENSSNCIAKVGLVKIIIKTDKLNTEQELIKAYKSITAVKECYKLIDTKTKEKHAKVLTETDLNKFHKTIDDRYFSFAVSKNKTSTYNTYLGICKNSSHYPDVLAKADNLKYSEADKEFTITSYNDYLKSYPNGIHYKEAKNNISMMETFKNIKNTKDCNNFILKFPQSIFVDEVKIMIDKFEYNTAKTINTLESYNEYIARSNNNQLEGRYIKDARVHIDIIHFEKAKKINTVSSYNNYMDKFPNGAYAQNASSSIENIYYLEAKNLNTNQSYKKYLKNYPNGTHKDEAISKLVKDMLESVKKISAIKDAVYKNNELAIIISVPLSSISIHEISGSSVNFINSAKVKACKTIIPSRNDKASEVELSKPHGALVIYNHEPVLKIPKHLIVKLNNTHFIVDGSGTLSNAFIGGFWVKNNDDYEFHRPKGSTVTFSFQQKDPEIGALHITQDKKNIVIPFIFNDIPGILISDRLCIFDKYYNL